ncbi:MAG: hypothetical protein VXZ43_04830 [Pseudomonadota bacterium]|nr:hypothetical protein [Pseudomonadota bacterium]
MAPRPLKKTETIEIRLPHDTKTAFMARCRAEGRTASDVLRRFIDAELAARPRRFDGRLLLAGFWPPWPWGASPRRPWLRA